MGRNDCSSPGGSGTIVSSRRRGMEEARARVTRTLGIRSVPRSRLRRYLKDEGQKTDEPTTPYSRNPTNSP